MHIHLWHGYLLSGSGSNTFARELARAWSTAGHDVVLFCQEAHAERFDVGSARVVRPEVGRILPVFVLDAYDGFEARRLADLTPDEWDSYLRANHEAVSGAGLPDVVVGQHILAGGAVAAESAARRRAVISFGSEIEYAIRDSEWCRAAARAALERVDCLIVPSAHSRAVVDDVLGDDIAREVALVPSGVDADLFRPLERATAIDGARKLGIPEVNRFLADLAEPDDRLLVVYAGRLSEAKGVDLLFEALRGSDRFRLLVIGVGTLPRSLEDREPERTYVVPELTHEQLRLLLPLADICVVPSRLPEAFPLVVGEAAAAGVLPLAASHSGLAEAAAVIADRLPPRYASLITFEPGQARSLRAGLEAVAALPRDQRVALGALAREAAVAELAWPAIADRVLSAAVGATDT